MGGVLQAAGDPGFPCLGGPEGPRNQLVTKVRNGRACCGVRGGAAVPPGPSRSSSVRAWQ